MSLEFNVTDHLQIPIQGQIEATIINARNGKSVETGKILVLGDGEPNFAKVDLSVKRGDKGRISIRFSPTEDMYSDFSNSPVNENIGFSHAKSIPSFPRNSQLVLDVRLKAEKRIITAESTAEAINQLVETNEDFKEFSGGLGTKVDL